MNNISKQKEIDNKSISNTRVFDEEYIDSNACCKFLGIAHSTLYAYTSKNLIPHFKVGKMIRFKKSELIAWIEVKRVPTEEENLESAKMYDLYLKSRGCYGE